MLNKIMNDINSRDIAHICFSVTNDELINMWVDLYHPEDYILVIHDPVNHMQYLRKTGFYIDDTELYQGKILVLQIETFDDALWVCETMGTTTGPYVQFWAKGKYICDNMEK